MADIRSAPTRGERTARKISHRREFFALPSGSTREMTALREAGHGIAVA
jgi:hypothetical protein